MLRSKRFYVATGLLAVSLGLLAYVACVTNYVIERPSLKTADPLSNTFLWGCLVLVAWTCVQTRSIGTNLGHWSLCSMPLSIVGYGIPFGDATVYPGGGRPPEFKGFCGMGFPIPGVMWDKGLDYPNPLALLLNPIVLFLMGGILIVIYRGIAWTVARLTINRLKD